MVYRSCTRTGGACAWRFALFFNDSHPNYEGAGLMTGPFFILSFFARGRRCQLGFLTGCMRLFANRCMTMFFGGVAVAGHGVPCPYTPTRGVAASKLAKLRVH